MEKKLLQDIGRFFYELLKDGEVFFSYGSETHELDKEIDRVCGLISYLQI